MLYAEREDRIRALWVQLEEEQRALTVRPAFFHLRRRPSVTTAKGFIG